MMDPTEIATVAELEAVIGKTPPAMHLKVIDHLDAGALGWIARSPLAFIGFGSGHGLQVTLAGGAAGFAGGDQHELRLPLATLDDPRLAKPGAPVGALFLLPGVGETLRVNGRVTGVDRELAHVAVEECYGHCAKAMIRSQFWSASPCAAPDDVAAFVERSRFLALATVGGQSWADLSPKGDPAGGMAEWEEGVIWFADRPGNRRADSFRNILERPHVALALLVPGSTKVAIVRGRASLTTDVSVRSRFTVQDKRPLLAVGVAIEALSLRDSGALIRAGLWPVTPEEGIEPTKLFIEHIRLNKTRGLSAALARASVSIPGMKGLMKKGLDKDYEDNLY
ncbi:pyridoxamine 5'-phosphate oxidase family protein [Novosphingobium sp. BL-8A]|uniref:pyridoxamine 5'-phosphate oxidase family protein n=1 Tax=Novosphingobium sp. BL-8A TaxID=3127639 RepID=UPI003756EA93